jgi:glutathione synthase
MKERLRADGLFFVGLDVIAGRLIEVNVTSPTLVQELRATGGPDLAAEVITAVEQGARN